MTKGRAKYGDAEDSTSSLTSHPQHTRVFLEKSMIYVLAIWILFPVLFPYLCFRAQNIRTFHKYCNTVHRYLQENIIISYSRLLICPHTQPLSYKWCYALYYYYNNATKEVNIDVKHYKCACIYDF